ncbi:glycosyltransferase family 2 protein [Coraliomargarita sinensis]|nr:glycosyltransferase family 2 protein [Coraliomargarita sinensis]
MLDISVIIPTRNSMGHLKAHLNALLPWLSEVKQVVVVDSESTDGTVEYFHEHLSHPNLVFIEHPPGLYESWNAAIQRVEANYLHFATVGDVMPFESLVELYQIAVNEDADVVLSPPEIVMPDGQRNFAGWPIHRYCEALSSNEPYVLPSVERFIWNVHALPGTLIGSSSSNLYRTSVLKSEPFPCEYGHAGDSAWAIARPHTERWVVAPAVESIFIKHASSGRQRWGSVLSRPKLYQLAVDAFRTLSRSTKADEPGYSLLGELHLLLEMYVQKGQLVEEWNSVREGAIPWFLQPRAIGLRRKRKQLDLKLRCLADDLCARVVGSEK